MIIELAHFKFEIIFAACSVMVPFTSQEWEDRYVEDVEEAKTVKKWPLLARREWGGQEALDEALEKGQAWYLQDPIK